MDYESKMAAMKSLMKHMDDEEDKKFRPSDNDDGGIGGDAYNDDMKVKEIKKPDEDDEKGGEGLGKMMSMFSSFIGK